MKEQATLAFGEILAFAAMFLVGLTPTLIAVGLLIMVDTFTGVWSAVKHKDKITSRRAGRIIAKLVLYPMAIIVAKVSEMYLSPDIAWTYITTSIIAVIEIKSIFENIGKILGYKLWDRIRKAIWRDKNIDEEGFE